MAGSAEAATWYAGPLWISPGDQIVCAAMNVSEKDVKRLLVEANIVDGPVTAELQPAGPKEIATAADTNGSNFARAGYCRFEFKGSKKSIRATACVRSGDGFGTCDTTIVPN